MPVMVYLVDAEIDMTSYFSMNEEESTDGFKVGPKQTNTSQKNLILDFSLMTELKQRVQFPYLKTWKPVYHETLLLRKKAMMFNRKKISMKIPFIFRGIHERREKMETLRAPDMLVGLAEPQCRIQQRSMRRSLSSLQR